MDRVCAIVVTFHPDALVPGNLQALRPQVAELVVVDNGSAPEELAMLRDEARRIGFTLIENNDNLGIATALNIGVQYAKSTGAPFVMMFDQDSCATPGMVATMLHAFRNSSWGDRLGILVPAYTDRRLATPLRQVEARHGIEAAMTSGSLIRSETLARFGSFVDELFIDAVDYEYSLRLRRAGYVIAQCSEAQLLHSPGDPVPVRLFGRKIFQCANYSPLRQYYQERNKVWVARRYFRDFPWFCTKLFYYSAKNLLKILLGEHDKARKTRYFLRGTWDGLRNRMGKLRAG